MYNLLVSADEKAWEGAYFTLDEDRFLEHTDPTIAERFRRLEEARVSELLGFPAIFAYEIGVGKPARVGKIKSVEIRQAQMRIYYEFTSSISEFTSDQMMSHAWDFDINKYELGRTHWAVKNVDLSEALRELGISGTISSLPNEVALSRGSVIKAAGLLQKISHTDFDTMLLEFGIPNLDAGRDLGGRQARSNALAKYAVDFPESVTADGQNIGCAIVRNAIERTPQLAQYPAFEIEDPKQLSLIQSLVNDGVSISDHQFQTAHYEGASAVLQDAEAKNMPPLGLPEIITGAVAESTKGVANDGSYAISPAVFHVPRDDVSSGLISVMMPFDQAFNSVHKSIQEACRVVGQEGIRVDNVWEDTTVIQDVFSLIYRSKIVIVDFTDQNPNVFYETGIAHTLGKHVVPITQNEKDVPFDLRHHRHLTYLPNNEGLGNLTIKLASRLKTLMAKD
jgi:hypothetical protein